jgi:hypothetical protein|uniref:energy transducer TonB n=1 Tax=Altererythrobacter segetis TaxID=1104773 RepID=UPI00140DEAE1|nr:energy transducer TonB [Altererythrobacter segetis]
MGNLARSMAATAAAAILASLSLASWAQAPADPWKLGQASENCFLSRSFGSGAQKMDVFIQSFGSATPYHVILRGPGLPLRPQRAEFARITLGGTDEQDTFALIGKSGEIPMAVFAAALPRPLMMTGMIYNYTGFKAGTVVRIDGSAETLTFDMEDMEPLSLQLGPMAGEYERLDACAQALEDKWIRAASPTATPIKGPELLHAKETVWHMKYPENLLLNRISGLVELRMTVDAKGRARDCVVQMATWASRFGEDSCSALEQTARFQPATDSNGNPVSALFRTGAIFVIHDW